MGVKIQMRRPRERMRPNNTGMRGRSPSPDPTRTTRSRDQKIQELKRHVQTVRAKLDSLEMRTRTVRYGSTISGIRVSVDIDRCVGCGNCQSVCPVGAISIENVALVDSRRCTGCRLCLDQCPVGALSIIPLKNPQGEEACAVP